MSSSSKKTLNKYTPIPKSKDYEINTPNLSSYVINTPNCDLKRLEIKQKEIQDKINTINKIKKRCKSRYVKEEYKGRITLRELLKIIKRENKEKVQDFLELFAVLNEGKTTVNTVYEALWILVFLYRLDDLDNTTNRIFYKSIENPEPLKYRQILDGKVNEGNKGGIADIYFKINSTDDKPDDKPDNEFNCGDEMIKYPYCTSKSTQEYDRYMCSVKYFQIEKDVGSYDVDKIRTEAQNIKSNILLLVNDKETVIKKYERTGKYVAQLVTGIYGINDLQKYYKRLLEKLKNKEINPSVDDITSNMKILYPRLHQKYFINYTFEQINKKSKNFIWGAVPRSGKSYMIGGLISKYKPKYVLLFLGAITETKEQFINDLFLKYDDFIDYEIYDLQTKKKYNEGKEKKIVLYSQEWARLRIKDEIPEDITNILKDENKLIFFDEIHQGSGGEKQEDILNEFVFKMPYKAFIMVTATFAKPYLRYMNKSDIPIKIVNWSYENIQYMKKIKDNEDVEYILDKIKVEDDGLLKSKIFKKLIDEYIEYGGTYKELSDDYSIYPNLVVINIDKNISTENKLWYNNNLDIDGIFKPLMKNKHDKGPIKSLLNYIFTDIYRNILYKQGIRVGADIHTQLWFLPTVLKNDKCEEGKPFAYMCKHIVESMMDMKEFRDHFCVIILHKVGFDKTKIDFISSKEVKWNDASVTNTNKYGCVSTICSEHKMGVKNCILAQEACAKEHGKSVIILTGKMIRLGISLPCVDVALHFDPISSVDTIYQSMFRVLTERIGKYKGIFIDMNHERNVNFMYDLYNYQNQGKVKKSIDKQMNDFNDFLILYDLDGLSNHKNDNYKNMYDKLLEKFSLNNKTDFVNKLKINKLQDIFKDKNNKKYIEQFYLILSKYNIEYVKKSKGKELNIKYKENEVILFINDYITLFILFNEENIKNIEVENIKEKLDNFINEKITNISLLCKSNFENKDVLNCHLLNLILENTNKSEKEINKKFYDFKNDIKKIFNNLTENTQFLNIYDISILMINEMNDSLESMKTNHCIKSNVLSIIRDRLTVRKEEKNLYGEVFTPIELVCEMLDKIPDEVWKNPQLKWLDPANGIGNFPVVVYYKLMESLKDDYDSSKYSSKSLSKHIIEDMLYMVELNPVNSKVCEKIFNMIDPKSKPNIITKSFLDFSPKDFIGKNIDKFDVVFGNPPFQKKNNKGISIHGSGNLWTTFISKSFVILNNGGYLVFITPSSWMGGNVKEYKEMIHKQFIYLNINECKKYFKNINSEFSYYIIKNDIIKHDTKIICQYNKNIYSSRLFLNDNMKILPKLINKESISILNKVLNWDNKKIFIRKDNIKRPASNPLPENKTEEYKYPVITFIKKDTGLPDIRYFNKKLPTQDIKKILLFRSGYLNPTYDDGNNGVGDNILYYEVKSKAEGLYLIKLYNSKLYRFIYSILKYSSYNNQNVADYCFNLDVDINNIYKYFDLTNDEIKLIESIINDDILKKNEEDKTPSIPKDFFKTPKNKKTVKK